MSQEDTDMPAWIPTSPEDNAPCPGPYRATDQHIKDVNGVVFATVYATATRKIRTTKGHASKRGSVDVHGPRDRATLKLLAGAWELREMLRLLVKCEQALGGGFQQRWKDAEDLLMKILPDHDPESGIAAEIAEGAPPPA